MPAQRGAVPSKLRCEKPGCELTTFTTRSNLNRHNHSKHGTAIRMSCGKALPDHKSNIKRHQKACVKCCTALDQPSSPAAQTSFGSPTSATNGAMETTDFNSTHEFHLGEFIDMSFLMEDYTSEILQPE
ncbi:hypothetical protein CPAR01_08876 [Colletotrichum paranaense]|uniref:C2H2-type domain-containing protein n=1 Tax=Colletotrichum paranaense TaxID=1914294 RepID=A0ABQ9SG97_9PEZI|nr:uncharacterized protein CPAR01_08876 [Colletotrichum paranaense]KAK1535334.1 hypothetical protein CPAR01_08876 [Colletotrichum paranaense]